MKVKHLIGFLAALVVIVAVLFDASHGNVGIFYSTEGSLGVIVVGLLTWFSCGTSGFKALVTTVTAPAATDEQRQQAALVLETSGRLAHSWAAFLSFIGVIVMFQNLGSDISVIGGAIAISLLSFLYATLYSEFIAAPLHTRISPTSRWSMTPLMASGLVALVVAATCGFGAFACCPSSSNANPTLAPVPSSTPAQTEKPM